MANQKQMHGELKNKTVRETTPNRTLIPQSRITSLDLNFAFYWLAEIQSFFMLISHAGRHAFVTVYWWDCNFSCQFANPVSYKFKIFMKNFTRWHAYVTVTVFDRAANLSCNMLQNWNFTKIKWHKTEVVYSKTEVQSVTPINTVRHAFKIVYWWNGLHTTSLSNANESFLCLGDRWFSITKGVHRHSACSACV